MHKFLPFILLVIFYPLFSFSQQGPGIQWTASLGGTNMDAGTGVIQTADSGFLVLGRSRSVNGDINGAHGSSDFWLVKLNKAGTIQWKKSYGGSNDDFGNRIVATQDGGFLLGGSSCSGDGDATGHYGSLFFYDVWLIKIDSAGAIQWEKNYGGNGDDDLQGLAAVPGGFVFTAFSNSTDGQVTGNHGGNDYWVVKVDEQGNLLWQNSFGGGDDDVALSQPVITKDSGYIVVGESNSVNGQVTGNHGGYDFWVIKLSSTGSLQWQKSYGGSGNEHGTGVVQNFDSSYTVIGSSSSNNTGQVTNGHGSTDFWVINIDKTGNLNWQKTYGGSGEDRPGAINITTDSGYVVAGYVFSNNGDVIGNHGYVDFWILKFDSHGTLQWKRTVGGAGADKCYDVITTKDKGYALVGETDSNNGDVKGNHGNSDYLFLKFSEDSLLKNHTLSVSLLAFNGVKKDGQNILRWSTEKQINFSHFELQRSENGRQFTTVASIPAESAVQGISNYTYVDGSVFDRSYYYRLKQVDKDNSATWSNIIFINRSIYTPRISIAPNPAKNNVIIKYNSAVETDVVLNCYSAAGQLAATKTMHVQQGVNTFNWDISRYSAGSYVFVINNTEKTQQTFIKVN